MTQNGQGIKKPPEHPGASLLASREYLKSIAVIIRFERTRSVNSDVAGLFA